MCLALCSCPLGEGRHRQPIVMTSSKAKAAVLKAALTLVGPQAGNPRGLPITLLHFPAGICKRWPLGSRLLLLS